MPGPTVVWATSGKTMCGPKVVRAKSGLGQKWSCQKYSGPKVVGSKVVIVCLFAPPASRHVPPGQRGGSARRKSQHVKPDHGRANSGRHPSGRNTLWTIACSTISAIAALPDHWQRVGPSQNSSKHLLHLITSSPPHHHLHTTCTPSPHHLHQTLLPHTSSTHLFHTLAPRTPSTHISSTHTSSTHTSPTQHILHLLYTHTPHISSTHRIRPGPRGRSAARADTRTQPPRSMHRLNRETCDSIHCGNNDGCSDPKRKKTKTKRRKQNREK